MSRFLGLVWRTPLLGPCSARDKLDVMAYMHFVTAAGKGFTLNSRQYADIAWALHNGQIAELRLAEKDMPYQKYRGSRLGAVLPAIPQTDYAIVTCRSSQGDMDRMDESSFARLDDVILALHKLAA